MSRYFTHFKKIEYQGKQVRNITNRSKIRDNLLADPFIYLPYTIADGEKPETVAQLYYGSVDDTWIVLLANNITDPYYDWPLSDEEFDQYFIDKYSEFSNRTGFDVIRGGQNLNAKDTIVYYSKTIDKSSEPVPVVALTASEFIDVTNDQIQTLLGDGIITVDGLQYRLVEE
jgi:hypothetical protein